MRWLACAPGPNFSVYDLHVGYSEALKAAGETVVDFPLGSAITFYDSVFIQTGPNEVRKALDGQKATELAADRLAGALWKVRPDVLLITSGFFVDPVLLDIARADGVRIVLIATEQPYELTRELGIASHCDIALLTDPTTIGHFEQVCTARHQPHCYRPAVHRPGPARPELAADLAFIGTAYQSRIEFFEGMDLAGLDVMLAGNWQQLGDDSPLRTHIVGNPDDCLDNERTADVYRSAKVGLNLYRREAERPDLSTGWAVGPREVEMAACGAFFLRDPRPEGDELFPSLPTFAGPAEASEHLRWYLAHPAAREAAAGKAREAVADRTFDHAVAALLRLLDKE